MKVKVFRINLLQLGVLLLAAVFAWVATASLTGYEGAAVYVAVFVVAAATMHYLHYMGWKAAHLSHIDECESSTKFMMQQLASNGDNKASAAITKAEQNLLEALRELPDQFSALGEVHEGENDYFAEHIHHAMALVYARVGVRSSLAFQAATDLSGE